MSDSINNPFKVGGWYSLAVDGYSVTEDAEEIGVFLPDQVAVDWLFKEKLRRMGVNNE